MSQSYIGQITLFAGSYAPKDWHLCDGSVLNVQQYQALYAVLGNVYGGNPPSTFALPDLRGRVPVGQGQGSGLSNWTLGQKSGTEAVTLNTTQMPAHNHPLVASSGAGTTSQPNNNYLANATDSQGNAVSMYAPTQTATNMGANSIGANGGGQGHPNIQPSLGLNYIICFNGIYPSRN